MVFSEVTGHLKLINQKKKMKMRLSKRYIIFVLVLSSFQWAGCHSPKNEMPNTMLTGKAVIAADETLLPLMNAELDVFRSIYKYSSIDCKFLSEYDAINLLLQEKSRLAIVGRPLNQKEIDFFKSRDIIPQSIPFAYDAVALIVPSENKIRSFTTDQIIQLLSGTVTNWNQIDNSEKSGSIQLIFDTESSGIIRFLDEKLNLNKKISGDIKFAGNSKQLMEMVAENPNGIGFVGYNWLSETESIKVQETLGKVHLIAVSGKSNSINKSNIIPSISSIYNNTYPLTRKVYAIYTDPAASLARGFLAHLTSERGQKIIYRCGLKPENDFQREIKIINVY
jgi:phosphate transport system substrate-binding protein